MKSLLKRRALAVLVSALGLGALSIESDAVADPSTKAARRERSASASGTAAPEAALVGAVTSVEVVVSDLGRSRAFFALLGFVVAREDELAGHAAEQRTGIPGARVKRLELALGRERLTLLEFLAPSGGRPVPRDTRGNDLWFQHVAIVVTDMNAAYAWLRAHRVAHVSTGPQTLPAWNRAAGGIRAFYFADPDGHVLELIDFPNGKGDPRWQARTTCRRTPRELCLFLGIDHTAITVEDTDASLAFYRDRLGLRVAGESENYGTEQERLNGVFGARLRITALRADSGPGIELLEYLAPRGGRLTPADARANDLFHWQVVVHARDATAVAAAAGMSGGRRVSAAAGGDETFVRDRDGHALVARESAAP
jgi:catechol 2,3-dioxygenase-like lactoylglutathione lyase family enzyme